MACGGKGTVSKTAARSTDKKCSSVGRTHASDMGVGDVTRGVAGQGPVDESRNPEHEALPHRKPVQLAEHRQDMITSPGAVTSLAAAL